MSTINPLQNPPPIDSSKATVPGKKNANIAFQHWTVEKVTMWLKDEGFDGDICDKFTAHRIKGETLPVLDTNTLMCIMGIEQFGTVHSIIAAINGLQKGMALSDSAKSGHSDVPYHALAEVPASHPFVELWLQVWKSSAYKPFSKRQVERDDSGLSDIDIPSTCWVLETRNWMKQFDPRSSISGVLARDEYKIATIEVVNQFRTGTVNFSTKVDGEDKTMGVDELEQPFLNPFLDLPGDLTSTRMGFILMGHPGIGKTIWLFIILILRMTAGLPTILQTLKDRLFYFDNNGVRQLNYTSSTNAAEFATEFSPSTWCLIDTNPSLWTVPPFIQGLDRFIVQASSPRQGHIEWYKKQGAPVSVYYLKPWTLSELIVGCVI